MKIEAVLFDADSVLTLPEEVFTVLYANRQLYRSVAQVREILATRSPQA